MAATGRSHTIRAPKGEAFDGQAAFEMLTRVCDIGARVSGTEGMSRQQRMLSDRFQSIGGKVAGVMTGFWDDFTDKKVFFMIMVIAAFVGGILIYSRLKSLNQIVKDKTGSA